MKKIKTHLLLKIASAITFLYCAGHLSGFPWTPGLGENELSVIEGMKSQQFDADGAIRTYWEFYIGFGLIIGAFLLLQTVLLLQLSIIAKSTVLKVKWIIVSFIASFAINTFLSWKFFFSIPVILATIITLSLCLSFLTIRRSIAPDSN